MDQNEVTKHFSVGNTFRQSNDARSNFLYLLCNDMNFRPMVKSRPNMKKKTVKQWDLWWS